MSGGVHPSVATNEALSCLCVRAGQTPANTYFFRDLEKTNKIKEQSYKYFEKIVEVFD